jgi:uncharacterized membrane protein YeaQ/YmgE (transglycosylase-associated protein family)
MGITASIVTGLAAGLLASMLLVTRQSRRTGELAHR